MKNFKTIITIFFIVMITASYTLPQESQQPRAFIAKIEGYLPKVPLVQFQASNQQGIGPVFTLTQPNNVQNARIALMQDNKLSYQTFLIDESNKSVLFFTPYDNQGKPIFYGKIEDNGTSLKIFNDDTIVKEIPYNTLSNIMALEQYSKVPGVHALHEGTTALDYRTNRLQRPLESLDKVIIAVNVLLGGYDYLVFYITIRK